MRMGRASGLAVRFITEPMTLLYVLMLFVMVLICCILPYRHHYLQKLLQFTDYMSIFVNS